LAADDEVILAAELAANAFDRGAHLAGVIFVAEIVKGLVDKGTLMGRGARPDGGFGDCHGGILSNLGACFPLNILHLDTGESP
jgi:hypothetical protein